MAITPSTVLGCVVGIYLGSIAVLFAASLALPKLAFYARLLSSYLSLLLASAYGVVASIVLRLCGYGQVSQWAAGRCFKWAMWITTGVGFVVVEGHEHLRVRPAVFITNHQTELDVLLLGTVFPPYCSVTAKNSLKRVPVLGWFMALSKTVFIDRTNRQTAVAAFDGAATVMRRDRQSVFIFPEGTRSYFDEAGLLPFKKGAFHLAIKAKVPIVPVIVANYSHVLSARRRVFQAGTIPVKVLAPIPTANLLPSDADELTTTTYDLMLRELTELTGSAKETRHLHAS